MQENTKLLEDHKVGIGYCTCILAYVKWYGVVN